MIIGNLNLDTDFETRIIREDEYDIDVFIDLRYRTVDLDLGDNNLILSRIQFIGVRSIILRLSKLNNIMTLHMMKDIDLYSAFANFEMNYDKSIIKIKKSEEKVTIEKVLK